MLAYVIEIFANKHFQNQLKYAMQSKCCWRCYCSQMIILNSNFTTTHLVIHPNFTFGQKFLQKLKHETTEFIYIFRLNSDTVSNILFIAFLLMLIEKQRFFFLFDKMGLVRLYWFSQEPVPILKISTLTDLWFKVSNTNIKKCIERKKEVMSVN